MSLLQLLPHIVFCESLFYPKFPVSSPQFSTIQLLKIMQSSHALSLQAYSNVSKSKPSLPLCTSPTCDESDDALEIALFILDHASNKQVPAAPPPVQKTISDWRASVKCNNNNNKASRSRTKNHPDSRRNPVHHDSSAQSPRKQAPTQKSWSYAEDCLIAHVFSALKPDTQHAYLAQKLPNRSWVDARARFRYLCSVRKGSSKRSLKVQTSGTK